MSNELVFSDMQKIVEWAKANDVMFHVELIDGRPTLNVRRPIVSENPVLWHAAALGDGWHYGKPAREGIGCGERGPNVTRSLLDAMDNELLLPTSDVRRLSSLPVEKSFVYADISDFSRHPPGQQALIIRALVQLTKRENWNATPGAQNARDALEAQLCIGDGYIYVFPDPTNATFFAACLAHFIEVAVAKKRVPVEFHFRMGVHTGEVYHFWDNGRGGWNYIGSGINGGQRVVAAIGKDADDILFVSGEVRQQLVAGPPDIEREIMVSSMRNRGRRKDKQDQNWRVYEVDHTDVGSMSLPDFLKLDPHQ